MLRLVLLGTYYLQDTWDMLVQRHEYPVCWAVSLALSTRGFAK